MAIATISLAVQNRALNDEVQDQLRLVTNLAAQASKAQQVSGSFDRAQGAARDAD